MGKNNRNNSMTKKTLIYMAGNFSSKLFGMIIIPIYAKYLTASDLGTFDFQQTIGNLLMPITALAIWEAILRFGLNQSERKTNEVITTSVVISTITIFISSIILLATYIPIYGLSINTILYVALISTMPLVTIFGYISRAVKKNKIYASSGVVSAFFNLLFIIIFVVINDYGVTGLLLSAVGANIFNIVYLIYGTQLITRIKREYFSIDEAKILLSYSTPLIFNLTFGWFLNSFSRFYINLTLGDSANGVYAFASKFSGIFIQIASIFNMAVIEDAVESIENLDWKTKFENNISKISKIFFEFATILMILTSIYYNFVSNSEFKESIFLVPGLLLCGILSSYSTLIGNIFPIFNETKQVFKSTLYSGFSNIIFTVIFAGFFGLFGIVLAQIISSFILVVVRYIMGQRIHKFYINLKRDALYIISYLLVSLIVINVYWYIQFFILFCYIIYLFEIYRKSIEKMILDIRKRF